MREIPSEYGETLTIDDAFRAPDRSPFAPILSDQGVRMPEPQHVTEVAILAFQVTLTRIQYPPVNA